MTPVQKRSALKSAKLYLEMRGHTLIEQYWSSGKYKLDLIAKHNETMEFISLHYTSEDSIPDVTDTAIEAKRLTSSAMAWIEETKFSGKHKLISIDIYGSNYSVLGFNEL